MSDQGSGIQMLANKVGLIVGVANKRSISWAIAQAASKAGARVALTFQGERLEENVRELAEGLADPLVMPLDVTDDAQIARVFEEHRPHLRRPRLRRPRRRVRHARRPPRTPSCRPRATASSWRWT